MVNTIQALRQYQLVILRRLRGGPLTEFELVHEVADASGFTQEQCTDLMADWLEELRTEGFIWAGTLTNVDGQKMMAAALTHRGKELVA